MSTQTASSSAVTTRELLAMKAAKKPIVCVTAYDALFGRLVDESGVDVVLVGDSLNQVIAGEPTTLSATLDQMIYHTRMVRRGVTRAMLVIDMPFLTYQVSREEAIRNCGRALKETGAQTVKLEGGQAMAPTIRALTDIGIPVMGHIGLTPQSVHALGGYRVQGRDDATAARLEADAQALEQAGCYAIVLELLPAALAEKISRALTIPTIGIGAGAGCDGQVLVLHDMLGLGGDFRPKFARRFAEVGEAIRAAATSYVREVRGGTFPGDGESFR